MWGLRSPTPRGRTESCTLRILRMLLLVLTEEEEKGVRSKEKEEKREKMASLRPYTTPCGAATSL